MGYPYDEYGGANAANNENVEPANKVVGAVDNACPPRVLEFRIYPEYDFNQLFDPPPSTVIT